MPVTVRGTDILFNNGTTQSTAATPYFPSYGAVGNIIAGWSTATVGQTTYGAGTSVAGSALRVHPAIPLTASTAPNLSGVINPGLGGTWVACNRFVGNDGYGSAYNTLWMRIS